MISGYRLELVGRITASERASQKTAATAWQDFDVTTAVRHRGVAEGLDMARKHMLAIAGEERAGRSLAEPTPLESAMHSVWLHGDWRWLTKNMTTEQREAAADAVQRHSDRLGAQDDELAGPITDLRWWR